MRFEDWIEPNLLKLNTMDLKKVEIKDYSLTPMANNSGQLVLASSQKGEFVLDTPAGDQPWKLVQDLAFDPAKKIMIPRPMAADEELNVTNLDALKSALEDLKIVDVERKPGAVPADLRVRKLDDATMETLIERGFFVVPNRKDPDGPAEILSNSGDITLQLADGARYILRFGVTTGESSAAVKAKKKGDAKSEKVDKAKDDSSFGMDRYLFVAADFNKDAIPKPVLEKMPEEKPAEKAAEKTPEKKAPDTKVDGKDVKPVDGDKKGDAKKNELKKDEPAKKDEPKKDEVKKDEPKKDDVKKDEVAKEANTSEMLAAQRAEIEKENKRRQEEYDAKVVAGKKHAKELSDRFAQWYYVIPGQTYAKIHLDRKDIVKKKEPPKGGAGTGNDHDHGSPDSLPASPAATLEQLQKDLPSPEKK